jgi:hypothetical protein
MADENSPPIVTPNAFCDWFVAIAHELECELNQPVFKEIGDPEKHSPRPGRHRLRPGQKF